MKMTKFCIKKLITKMYKYAFEKTNIAGSLRGGSFFITVTLSAGTR